jgi:hypothetical protein
MANGLAPGKAADRGVCGGKWKHRSGKESTEAKKYRRAANTLAPQGHCRPSEPKASVNFIAQSKFESDNV